MADNRQVNKCVKNVVTNLKIKRKFSKERDIFSFLQILPEDVFNDADANNIQVTEVEQSTQPKKKKKFNKQLLSWLFILLNIVIVAVIFINQTSEGGIRPISELFAEGPYYRFLFLGLGLMCFILLMEGVKFALLSKQTTGKFRPLTSLKVAVIGRYWDCITPFGSGGQPFQIYFLSKNGYSADNATGLPIAKHMFWTMSFCIISVIVIITPIEIAHVGNLVKYLAWFGILGNILLFSFILLMSINNRLGGKILNGILKLLHKMRIVKDYDKAYTKSHETFDNYQRSIKKCFKNPGQFMIQFLLAAGNIILNATVAYCVYLAFNYAYIMDGTVVITGWLQIVSMSILCDAAVSLIPLPGGSGAAELSFIGLFGLLFRDDMKFWAMLFWRIFTYYGIILIGLIFTVCDSVSTNRRRKRLVNVENLIINQEE